MSGNAATSDYWRKPLPETFEAVVTTESGLSADEAASRLATWGRNEIVQRHRRHLMADFARRLANPLILILLVASAIAGMTGDLPSFLIILFIVCLSTGLDTLQERRAEAMADALRRSIALTTHVRRDGVIVEVPVGTLVPATWWS